MKLNKSKALPNKKQKESYNFSSLIFITNKKSDN